MINITSITPDRNDFLKGLDDIFKPPKKLFFIGNLPTARSATVSIVGSRKPTTYGRETAHMIASELAKKGVIVVSGLALGIDTIAHKATLEVQGTTVAVLGSGLKHITPTTNYSLGMQIIKNGGAIISEYEPEILALPHRFLERNRIVSGLADVIIVVEAAKRSGTLSTAAHALNQGKTVYAVPGNITSPMSEGCNNLIKQGANIFTSVDDILLELGIDKLNSQLKLPIPEDPIEQKIIELMRQGENEGEEMLKSLNIDLRDFNYALTMLEIQGLIISEGANRWILR